jgi:hypothetical protein
MIHFTGHTEQLVTPNHRMMFRQSAGSPRRWGEITEAHASDLMAKIPGGRVQFVRNGYWEGDTRPTYRTSDLIGVSEDRGGNHLPEVLSASWLARFFGWFITEGTSNTRGDVHLTGMKDGQKDIFSDLFAEVGLSGRVNPKYVAVYSQELQMLVNLAGGKQDVRRVPPFIKEMDEEYLQEFLDAAIAGDGTRYGQSARIYTMSQALAYDYAEIGMKCGHSAKVSRRTTLTFDGAGETETFYTNLSPRSGSNVGSANIEEVSYDGDVWCLSVSTGRVFTTRNDGGLVLTGQTMNIIGERQDVEKFVPKVIRAVEAGSPIDIHVSANGTPGSRAYLHARNQADALLYIVEHMAEYGDLYDVLKYDSTDDIPQRPLRVNVVGNREVDNEDMVELIAAVLGKEPVKNFVNFHQSRPGHDLRYALDGSQLAEWGWEAPVSFTDSLARTVEWTLANRRWL